MIISQRLVLATSVWDAAADFSTTQSTNVNGVWEYGYVVNGSYTFVPFTQFTANFTSGGSPTGLNAWSSVSGSHAGPSLIQNPQTSSVALTADLYNIPAKELALVANMSTLAYVRFTAPSSGKYAVKVTYSRAGSTDSRNSGILALAGGTVILNNASYFSSTNVHGTLVYDTGSTPITLTAGDTVDCLVPINPGVVTGFNAHIVKVVSVMDYGAAGNGTTDDTSAIQSAVNSGSSVYFPAGTYKVTSLISVNQSIEIFGLGNSSIIKSDSAAFAIYQPYTRVRDLRLVNITAPFLVDRFGDGQGYQPTVNDWDVWGSLTTTQRNQDIGPAILGFANHLSIERLTGEFLSILFWNTSYSSVTDCVFRAGKNFAGGILFWKDSSALVTRNNSAINNTITYASYSGICIAGGYECTVSNNTISKCGESGVKTWQDTTAPGVDGRCQKITIVSNTSTSNLYDGFDVGCENARTGTYDTQGTAIWSNVAAGNGGAGFYGDGSNFDFYDNVAESNGASGFLFNINYSTFELNRTGNNNLSHSATGQHEASLGGSGLTILNNTFTRTSWYAGYGLYTSSTSARSGNTFTYCTQFLY